MNFYKCGFYSGYLHNLKPKIAGLDFESVLKSLCSFSCEAIIPSQNSRCLPPTDAKLIAVYENLLSRGVPTFPSLLVERALTRLPHPHIPIQEESETGSFEFLHPRLDSETEGEWLDLLTRAHCLVDPRLTNIELFHNPFDSDAERTFFYGFLPNVGAHALQLTEPQRGFESLVKEDEVEEFFNQRVDFAIDTKGIRTIIEIDGEPRDHILDEKRNKALKKNGWQVVRIPTRDLRNGRVCNVLSQLRDCFSKDRYFDLTEQNYHSPLWDTALGKKALQLVLTPFAIARLQKIFLLALRASVLSLSQPEWNFVVVERDVPCAQLAVLDFLQTLQAFYKLLEIGTPLPKVELLTYTTPKFVQFDSGVSKDLLSEFSISTERRVLEAQEVATFEANLLLDISTLQRYGFTKPEVDFCKQHLGPHGVAVSIRSVHTPGDEPRIQSTEPITYPMTDDKREPLRFFLQNIFRKKDFREGQFEILKRSLARKPVIGLLPTGAGKSLCYQLSALLQPGVTLVIDPLCSLMFDQADNLKAIAIDRIQFINSEQTAKEQKKIIEKMVGGGFQIVFISPERLQKGEFRAALIEMTKAFSVPYAVIDEAHCVSEWGHDFRTAYLNLARTVQEYCCFQEVPPTIIALTGTASYAVLGDVQREVGIDDEDAKIYPRTFDRKELKFRIHTCPSSQKRQQLLDVLDDLPCQLQFNGHDFYETNGNRTQSGIVFVPHVTGKFGVEEVSTFLSRERGIPVEFYSGDAPKTFQLDVRNPVNRKRLWDKHKREVQQRFKANEFPLLVSTKAFGMGIDKPNIRYTIHYGIPQSLEAFYQEAGRAGRDAKDSICTLIFSDDNVANANRFLDQSLTADELAQLAEPPWSQRGDIHRMMYFHRNAFRGPSGEMETLKELLNEFIYRHLNTLELNRCREINIPFGSGDQIKSKREKAIYRLSIIGVVQDYTIDFNANRFEVTTVKREESEYLRRLQSYIARYKTQDQTATDQNVQQRNGRNSIEKCLGCLIEFVYEEIAKKRQAAISTMAEVARTCRTDEAIRAALLDYLERSPFTEPLLRLATRIEPQEWWDVLEKRDEESDQLLLRDVDRVGQVLWGCSRTLESYPSHPGLYFLRGFARLLLPNKEVEKALGDIRSGFQNLKNPPVSGQEDTALQFLTYLGVWFEGTEDFETIQSSVAELALDELPIRATARAVYHIAPARSENILLNLTLQAVKNFNQQFLGRTQNA